MRTVSAIKQELMLCAAETEVGFAPDPEAAARVRMLAVELERMNPTLEASIATRLLRGHWKLLYSNVELRRHITLGGLSFSILPPTPVNVFEMFNQIDPYTGLWDNVVSFDDPETGVAGTLVVAGQYFVEDMDWVELEFGSAIVTTGLGRVVTPISREQLPLQRVRTTYLDDGFRMIRSDRGNLYIFERLDAAPVEWARHY